jgi:hypothetical protein
MGRLSAIQLSRMRNFLREIARVVLALPHIELARRREGPAPLVNDLRCQGSRCRPRTEAERRRLQAVIARVDARMPDGGNCYRRALLEIALDSDAAREPLFMGLSAGCEPMSGHAWIGSEIPSAARRYDAIFSV